MSDNPFQAKMQARLERAKNMTDEEKLYRFKGVLYPTLMCPEENLKCLDNIKAREDDIMLVAYPKCGECGVEFLKVNFVCLRLSSQMVEEAPSPRFLGTHFHPDNIPATFKEKKPKMLVVFRNPKDTLVSYYHFCNNNPVLPSVKSWDSFFTDFMSGNVAWGSYFDHALAWEKRMDDPDVMVVTYEDLKQDLSAGIRQVSTFFGFTLTDDQVQQIAGASSFSAMKESSTNSHGNMGKVIFRKGEVGDWKNHFTPEQSREMDEAFNKLLAGTKLGAKLNYNHNC
uniref:Sulfotransferase n=1 Tax=Kryptolebias marmoratus TaxID=37003 RepID=A0A3Q3BES5_KRYMA